MLVVTMQKKKWLLHASWVDKTLVYARQIVDRTPYMSVRTAEGKSPLPTLTQVRTPFLLLKTGT